MSLTKNIIALSFDIEEFDVPSESGVEIHMDRQIDISTQGLMKIFDILDRHNVKATFFCTAVYALAKPELIKKMVELGHEVASHSFYHSKFSIEDILESKRVLEHITGKNVVGYRSPRMSDTNFEELKKSGYIWDSSLNPCYLPGRYNNFKAPRLPHITAFGMVELPTSVSNCFRIPLFWLSIHNFPFALYKNMCKRSLRKTGFLNIYMHPWEFSDVLHDKSLKLPFIIKNSSGKKLEVKLNRFIEYFKGHGDQFGTLSEVASASFNS